MAKERRHMMPKMPNLRIVGMPERSCEGWGGGEGRAMRMGEFES